MVSTMHMVSRRTYLGTVASAGLASLAGCSGGSSSGDGPITIGFNAPLSGFASADGKSAEQGAKLAKQLINDNGGVNGRDIEILVEDDGAVADQAVPVAKDFINNKKVDIGISGSYSTPTRSISSLYNKEQIPFLSSYATHPDITNGKYTYRIGIWAPLHGKVGAKVAKDNLDASSAAVLIVDNDFGNTITDQFIKSAEEQGIEIGYTTKYQIGETDFRSALSTIKDNKPDLLYASGYYNEASHIVKQAKEIGLEARIMGEEGYDSPKFFDLGGPATNGTIITTNLNRDSDREPTKTFLENYRAEWDMAGSMVAASCYDAVRLAANAIEMAGSTNPDDVVSEISGISDWKDCATGPVSEFVGPGEAVRPITVQEVKDQKWTEFTTITDEDIIRPDV